MVAEWAFAASEPWRHLSGEGKLGLRQEGIPPGRVRSTSETFPHQERGQKQLGKVLRKRRDCSEDHCGRTAEEDRYRKGTIVPLG